MQEVPDEWRLLFLLLAHTGLRIGELLGLTWASVHLGDDAQVTVREQIYKGRRKALKSANAYRSIPLSPAMARAMCDWQERATFTGDGEPVFASASGTPIGYANLYNRVLAPARRDAGIPADEVGGFHAFRRTLASIVHDSGRKTNRQLCDWLGHHDPAFTMREYVGTMDAGLGDADFLDEILPRGLPAPRGEDARPS